MPRCVSFDASYRFDKNCYKTFSHEFFLYFFDGREKLLILARCSKTRKSSVEMEIYIEFCYFYLTYAQCFSALIKTLNIAAS